MFFAQTSLGAHTVHGLTLYQGKPLPPVPLKPPNCLANLLCWFAYASVFTGELVSPYLHYCIIFSIHILK